ncbi:MAG: glycosyltransferase family 4 protein [Actinomycetota bacterium]
MPVCAIVSFRLGLSDGVSVVATAWEQALQSLGWSTTTVAGDGPVDHLVPGLAIGADAPPDQAAVDAALAGADVVLVENLLTIPMNLPASRVVAEAIGGRPAVLHHHDPPWQRARFADITELPVDDPAWLHVTINRLTQGEFEQRGLIAQTIYNGFDADPPTGERHGTRRRLGLDDDAVLVAHPVRAIARKNVPAAIGVAEHLGGTYWLPGPAEEGYGDELAHHLDRARCPISRQPVDQTEITMPDLYAAADVIAFPSTWEGFGNPPVEAAHHRRPVVIGDYPVAEELRRMGFGWYGTDELDALARGLADPDGDRTGPAGHRSLAAAVEANRAVAARELSLERMTAEIGVLFDKLAGSSR